jgi:hypothetical protein
MDSLLFVPLVADSKWVLDILPSMSPAELPVAGRRFVDYGLEYAMKAGGTLLEVLDWNWSKRLAEYFASPERTGSALFYERGTGPFPRGLDDIMGINTPLTHSISDGLVVVWGLCMPLDMTHVESEPVTPTECANTPAGIYRRERGTWTRLKLGMFTVRDAKDWHELNFTVLHSSGKFTLPGYSAERDVRLGRNVVLEHGVNVKPPVLLQDNVWCARNVHFAGDVIVGAGTFIAEGATMRRTVVCDNTYIGAGLHLDGKIVAGNRIIDVETGVWTDVEDEGIARRIRHGSGGLGWLRALWSFLLGHSRGRRY